MVKLTPTEFIARLREIYPKYADMSGGCMKFVALLKAMYPQGVVLYDDDHFIIEIGGECYDIDGVAIKDGHIPPSMYGSEYMRRQWSHQRIEELI